MNLDNIPYIDDWDDCDGESVHVFLRDKDGNYAWKWVAIDDLLQYGRSDIVEQFFPDAAWNMAA